MPAKQSDVISDRLFSAFDRFMEDIQECLMKEGNLTKAAIDRMLSDNQM